jgi:hypothetical protein
MKIGKLLLLLLAVAGCASAVGCDRKIQKSPQDARPWIVQPEAPTIAVLNGAPSPLAAFRYRLETWVWRGNGWVDATMSDEVERGAMGLRGRCYAVWGDKEAVLDALSRICSKLKALSGPELEAQLAPGNVAPHDLVLDSAAEVIDSTPSRKASESLWVWIIIHVRGGVLPKNAVALQHACIEETQDRFIVKETNDKIVAKIAAIANDSVLKGKIYVERFWGIDEFPTLRGLDRCGKPIVHIKTGVGVLPCYWLDARQTRCVAANLGEVDMEDICPFLPLGNVDPVPIYRRVLEYVVVKVQSELDICLGSVR